VLESLSITESIMYHWEGDEFALTLDARLAN